MKLHSSIKPHNIAMIISYALMFELPIFHRLGDMVDYIFFGIHMVLIIVFGIGIITKKKVKLDIYTKLLLLMVIWMGIVVIVFTGRDLYSIYSYMRYGAYPILSVILICYWIFSGDYHSSIKSIARYYALAIWINFASMIIFPNGIVLAEAGAVVARANWIFGSKNNIVYTLPLLLLIFSIDGAINQKKNRDRILRVLTFLLMFLSFSSMSAYKVEFLSGSTTALVMILIYILLILLFSKHGHSMWFKWINIKNICLFSMVLMLLLTYVSQGNAFPKDSFFNRIIEATGKDIGFSGRNSVWLNVLETIVNSPIYGIGHEERIYIAFSDRGSTNVSQYSFWYFITVRYGLVGLVLLATAFAFSESKKKRGSFKYEVYACFILMMIGGLTYPLELQNVVLMLTIYHMCSQKEIKYTNRIITNRRFSSDKRRHP